MRMCDPRLGNSIQPQPVISRPSEPAVLRLVEDVQWLVAQLCELRAPSGAAAHGLVVEDRPDDVDFLTAVDLIPERLQNLADGRTVGVQEMHEAPDVGEAHIAGEQFLVIEYAHAAASHDGMAVECEVDLLDPAALRAGAEFRFRARRAATEQDAFGRRHRAIIASPCRTPARLAPATLLRTCVGYVKQIACTPSSWSMREDSRFAWCAAFAAANTTIGADPCTRHRARVRARRILHPRRTQLPVGHHSRS